jgi:single-strand DNA-binding protein
MKTMSSTLNQVTLIGNVGNVEVRDVNGKKYAKLSVATSEGGGMKDGQPVPEVTMWHNVMCFDGQASTIEKCVTKGDKVGIVGRLRERKYTDSNNIERKEISIVASNVVLMSKKAAQPQPQTQSDNDWPFQ